MRQSDTHGNILQFIATEFFQHTPLDSERLDLLLANPTEGATALMPAGPAPMIAILYLSILRPDHPELNWPSDDKSALDIVRNLIAPLRSVYLLLN